MIIATPQGDREATPQEIADFAAMTPSLAERRERVWEAIKAYRKHLSEGGGYKVAVGGVDKWFHSDTYSKMQQLGLVELSRVVVAAGAGVDDPLPGAAGQWKTMDNSFVTMTPTLANVIFLAAAAQDGAVFGRAEVHRLALTTAVDPESYDWSTGWPAVYPGFA